VDGTRDGVDHDSSLVLLVVQGGMAAVPCPDSLKCWRQDALSVEVRLVDLHVSAEHGRGDEAATTSEDPAVGKHLLTIEGVEGYFLNYYPKKKCKHYAGVALKNQEWKNLVINHVKIDNNRLWVIPFKQNILKQIDEINICSHVITDDYLALHISLALRKNVEFLTGKPLPYKLETFGNGTLHILSNVKEI
jgi:hypothetical protein